VKQQGHVHLALTNSHTLHFTLHARLSLQTKALTAICCHSTQATIYDGVSVMDLVCGSRPCMSRAAHQWLCRCLQLARFSDVMHCFKQAPLKSASVLHAASQIPWSSQTVVIVTGITATQWPGHGDRNPGRRSGHTKHDVLHGNTSYHSWWSNQRLQPTGRGWRRPADVGFHAEA
jgi:hypothetical protein